MKVDFNKVFCFLLVMLPILNIYGTGIPGVSIGKLLILIVLGLGFTQKIFTTPSYPRFYLLYFLYYLIIPQIFAISTGLASPGGLIYKSVGSLFIGLTFGYAYKYADYKTLLKYYEKVVMVVCVAFLLQEVLYFLFHYRLILLVPGTMLADGGSIYKYFEMQSLLPRSTSFFLEPAHFAQYISIYLIIKLFAQRRAFADKPVIFISLILLLTRSGNALMILVLCWGIWIIYCLVKRQHLIACAFTIGAGLAAVPVILMSSNEVVTSVTSRIGELSTEDRSYTSGFIRIYRGYILYDEMSTREKIIGIGQGNIENYVETRPLPVYSFLCLYNKKDMLYINGIQQHLVFGGMIGLILYALLLFSLMRRNTMAGKLLILLIILISLIAMTYNSITLMLMMIFSSVIKKTSLYERNN